MSRFELFPGLARSLSSASLSHASRRAAAWLRRHRDPLTIFALALGLRLLFSALMAGTYDKDEFVYLALGRDVAHGAIPYRDFPFFHPPGILIVLATLDPLTTLWWPLVRLIDVLLDSCTAVLVWYIARTLYERRAALIAGILYVASPVVLISAVRVDQEVLITALGTAALALLISRRSLLAAGLAGACLGAAIWIKYPMIAFTPVLLLAAGRRWWSFLLGVLAAATLLFAPYLGDFHRLYSDSIAWQLIHRQRNAVSLRLHTTLLYWLVANPFSVASLLLRWNTTPLWLAAGFATGGVFLFAAAVYSHYFVPLAPYAALLGAPAASRLVPNSTRVVPVVLVAVTVGWAAFLTHSAPSSGPIIAMPFSRLQPVITQIKRTIPARAPILASRFEYAYLSGHPWVAHYFWDQHDQVSAQWLARQLTPSAVVLIQPGAAYPPAFLQSADIDRTLRIGRHSSSRLLGLAADKPPARGHHLLQGVASHE